VSRRTSWTAGAAFIALLLASTEVGPSDGRNPANAAPPLTTAAEPPAVHEPGAVTVVAFLDLAEPPGPGGGSRSQAIYLRSALAQYGGLSATVVHVPRSAAGDGATPAALAYQLGLEDAQVLDGTGGLLARENGWHTCRPCCC
jgi:hypothetical protein